MDDQSRIHLVMAEGWMGKYVGKEMEKSVKGWSEGTQGFGIAEHQ